MEFDAAISYDGEELFIERCCAGLVGWFGLLHIPGVDLAEGWCLPDGDFFTADRYQCVAVRSPRKFVGVGTLLAKVCDFLLGLEVP